MSNAFEICKMFFIICSFSNIGNPTSATYTHWLKVSKITRIMQKRPFIKNTINKNVDYISIAKKKLYTN